MQVDKALETLKARAVAGRSAQMVAYHKAPRVYLGVPNGEIDALAMEWRRGLTLGERLELAAGLWATDVHEARIAAAKLLTQARLRPDDAAAWEMICAWVPDFDAWAIADHVSIAGQKRLLADPSRINRVEGWTRSDHMWTRRAALVMTLPWTKPRDPAPTDVAIRERVLGWAASYVPDREWFIQKAVAWWLRELSKKHPESVRAFLAEHGAAMKPFARREAAKYLADGKDQR